MKRALEWMLRLGLAALFAYAGVIKLIDTRNFSTEIANYHLLSALAPWLAVTLPAIEVALAIALVIAPVRWRRAASLAIAMLLAVFTIAVAQALARHINISCGCFGSASSPLTTLTLLRDLGLLLAAIVLMALTRRGARTPGPAIDSGR